MTAKAVIPVLDKIIGEFGVPKTIKTDNGPPFNSSTFADFARYKGFHHRKITPLWPLANAEVERFMRTVKKTMKAAISEGKSWNQYLHAFLLNYRATPHSSTGVPPATIMFGREIETSIPQVIFKEPQLDILEADNDAKLKMKTYADKRNHAKPSTITIGDPVLIKSDNTKSKAAPPYDPKPLVVTERKGSMITAERNGRRVTRNSSFFKPSPKLANDVPSDEEEEDEATTPLEPLVETVEPQQAPQIPVPQQAPQTPVQRTPAVRRSRRARNFPNKFRDFVMN